MTSHKCYAPNCSRLAYGRDKYCAACRLDAYRQKFKVPGAKPALDLDIKCLTPAQFILYRYLCQREPSKDTPKKVIKREAFEIALRSIDPLAELKEWYAPRKHDLQLKRDYSVNY